MSPEAEVEAIMTGLTDWLVYGSFPPAESSVFVNGKLIDLVAVRHALEGAEAEELSTAEKRFAAAVGTRAGLSAKDIGKRIGTTQRSVVRYRRFSERVAA
jgi:hypothetical protein